MFSKTIPTAFAASLLLASANAHFFISSPAPISGNSIKNPLDPSGNTFPCHSNTDWKSGQPTSMAVGSQVPLKFELGGGANTAVHGGGSCQISISYSTDPAALKKPENWKVIHSFLGNCPTSAKGNLVSATACSGSAKGECVSNLGFPVPKEVRNGDAVLAWTWFNNIGNREMYMNCAKVTFSGGEDKLDSLPSMFVANLASINSCSTKEQVSVRFPNPGAYVTEDKSPNYPLGAPGGSCGSSGVGTAPAGGSGAGAGGAATAASPSATAGAGAGTGGGRGSGTRTGAAPAATTAATGTGRGSGGSGTRTAPGPIFAENPTNVPAAPAAPAAPVDGGSGSGSGSGSCSPGQVPCSATGFYCISATQFGQCSFGCATAQDVAAGTSCSGNAVVHALAHSKRWNRHLHGRRFLSNLF